MNVSIFQPTYLPWLGIFKAIEWADKFVFLDDVQFENHSWQSRNRIKSSNGDLTLTVPVIRKFPQDIKDVKINYSQNWVKKHLKSIETNYKKSSYFESYFQEIDTILNNKHEKLLDLNLAIIKNVCKFLKIETEFHLSSEFGVRELRKNKKLVSILDSLIADNFLYAVGASEYMKSELNLYQDKRIALTPLSFEHPVYDQLYGEFISHLSILDIIFNCGREKTISMIKNIKLEKNE